MKENERRRNNMSRTDRLLMHLDAGINLGYLRAGESSTTFFLSKKGEYYSIAGISDTLTRSNIEAFITLIYREGDDFVFLDNRRSK